MNDPHRRVTNAEIIRRLLEKGSSEHGLVGLTRNAKGDVQIAVEVRFSEGSAIATPEDAERIAGEVYDRLASRYAYPSAPPAV